MKNKPAKIAYTPDFIGAKNPAVWAIWVSCAFLTGLIVVLFLYWWACHVGVINFRPVFG